MGFIGAGDKAHTDTEFDVRHELNRLSGLLRCCDALVNGLGYHCTATEFYWCAAQFEAIESFVSG